MKEVIEKTLKESWNGIAVNGTPFTQWKATEGFFQLWKLEKDRIKRASFSLYKHDERGWVVTYFGDTYGKFADYESYLQKENQQILDNLTEFANDTQDSVREHTDTEGLLSEIERISKIEDPTQFNKEVSSLLDREWEGTRVDILNY